MDDHIVEIPDSLNHAFNCEDFLCAVPYENVSVDTRLIFNMQSVSFINPYGMLILALTGKYLHEKTRIPAHLAGLQPNVYRYLERMNFWEHTEGWFCCSDGLEKQPKYERSAWSVKLIEIMPITLNNSCDDLYSVIGEDAYGDAAGGKRNTEDQIAVGADVIFGQGDGASFGMLQACSTKKAGDGGKVWFIDVIGDKRSIDRADVLLSSLVFDFSVVYDEIIQSIIQGTFGKQHWISIKNSGIYLLEPNKAVPQGVRTEIEAARLKILSGEIDVVDIVEAADLHSYFSENFPR